jgi:hypothetical protein
VGGRHRLMWAESHRRAPRRLTLRYTAVSSSATAKQPMTSLCSPKLLGYVIGIHQPLSLGPVVGVRSSTF